MMRELSFGLWGVSIFSVIFFGGFSVVFVLIFGFCLVFLSVVNKKVWTLPEYGGEGLFLFFANVFCLAFAVGYYQWLALAIIVPSILLAHVFESKYTRWPKSLF